MGDKDTELLPCPFCPDGGKPKKVTGKHMGDTLRTIMKVQCKNCYCQTDYYPYTRKTTPKAVVRWNHRPNTPQSSEVDVDLKLLKKQVKGHIKQSFEDDEDLTDAKYTVNETINYLSAKGYLKTPAENLSHVNSSNTVEALEWVNHKIQIFEGAGETENLRCLYTIRAALQQPKADEKRVMDLLVDTVRRARMDLNFRTYDDYYCNHAITEYEKLKTPPQKG